VWRGQDCNAWEASPSLRQRGCHRSSLRGPRQPGNLLSLSIRQLCSPVVTAIAQTLIQSSTEGELNVQFCWSRPVVEEGAESVNDGTSRHHRCARSVWPGIRERIRSPKALRCRSSADRSRPKSALGKIQTRCSSELSIQSCSDPKKADALGSCAKEDRRGAKGAMGEGEGREEDGLALDSAAVYGPALWLKSANLVSEKIILPTGPAADAAANLVGTGPADPDRRVRSVEQTKEQPPPASLQTSLGSSHIGQRTPSGLNPGSLPHPSNGSQPRHRIRRPT
jgi:hypothetical protein